MAHRRTKASVDGPTDISVLLGRILESPEVKGHLDGAILVQRWPEIVGVQVATKVQLVDFHEGTLVLRCESAAWRSELKFAKKAILERSNALLGKPIAQEIRFV